MHMSSVRSSIRLAAGLLSVAASANLSIATAGAKPTQMAPVPLQWRPSGEARINVAAAPWLPSRIVVTHLRDSSPH